MSYFTHVFVPSRIRVFQRLFSEHPWIVRLRKLLLGETIRFGVNFTTGKECYEYTLEEGPDGSLRVFEGLNSIDFKVLKTPLNLVIHVNEDYLSGWVEKEEKMMKHPLPYFFYYTLRILPKLRLN